jgi:hypothetical protein
MSGAIDVVDVRFDEFAENDSPIVDSVDVRVDVRVAVRFDAFAENASPIVDSFDVRFEAAGADTYVVEALVVWTAGAPHQHKRYWPPVAVSSVDPQEMLLPSAVTTA